MTEQMLYVVVASKGEYSDRYEWVTAVYQDRDTAVEQVTTRLKAAREAEAVYNRWHTLWQKMVGNMRYPYPAYLHDRVQRELGPAPSGPEADDFTIFEVPLGQWGRWDSFNVGETEGARA